MAVTIALDPTRRLLRIQLSGIDALLGFRRELVIPFSDLQAARVETRKSALQGIGLRVGGSYVPGRIATGHYLVKKQPGKRQFWSVYRDPEVLVIDTSLAKPSRVVLQTANRVCLAARINEVIAEGR